MNHRMQLTGFLILFRIFDFLYRPYNIYANLAQGKDHRDGKCNCQDN